MTEFRASISAEATRSVWAMIMIRRRSKASASPPPTTETVISGIAWASPEGADHDRRVGDVVHLQRDGDDRQL